MLKPGVFLDTFEESFRNNMFAFFFAISTLVILSIGLAFNMDIVNGVLRGATLFGEVIPISFDNVQRFVERLQAGLAMLIATIGLLLALLATSTLFPPMLQKGSIDLLLCRPIPRWRLMAARYLGGVSIVAFNAAYLILGVWLVLGLKSGIWNAGFPMATALLVFAFAVLFAVIMLFSVITENGAVGLLVAYAIFMFSPVLAAHEHITPVFSKELYRDIFRSLYWFFPKTAETIGAIRRLIADRPLDIMAAVLTSLAFAAGCFIITMVYFTRKDY